MVDAPAGGNSPARFKDLCLDSGDHQALADWWCAAFGYVRKDTPDDGTPREQDWPALIIDPAGVGPDIWINPVPEPKLAKNRLHFDVDAPFRIRDAEADAGYLPLTRVSPGEAVHQQVVESPVAGVGEVVLDFDAQGRLLGVQFIGRGTLPRDPTQS